MMSVDIAKGHLRISAKTDPCRPIGGTTHHTIAIGPNDFNWGRAIGVMNYWNYFNARPGVEPAGMLILDDVHLLEGPLRDFFTVAIRRGEALYAKLLDRIVARCPYYTVADDLLNEVDAPRPPEMLVFPTAPSPISARSSRPLARRAPRRDCLE
jgi:hypothetical protein